MDEEHSRTSWTKGLLSFLILSTLSEQRAAHGYAIAQQLSGAGLGPIKGGTLYPVLNRLEAEGTIAGTWSPGVAGPGRKSFSLTDAGHRRLAILVEDWTTFSAAIDRFTDPLMTATTTKDKREGSE